jgi:hypothetical protein
MTFVRLERDRHQEDNDPPSLRGEHEAGVPIDEITEFHETRYPTF